MVFFQKAPTFLQEVSPPVDYQEVKERRGWRRAIRGQKGLVQWTLAKLGVLFVHKGLLLLLFTEENEPFVFVLNKS